MEVYDRSEQQALVLSNLTHSQHSIIARLKCGVLALAVETGRCKKTDREIRVCRVCTSNEVEDEVHIVSSCGAAKGIRDELLKELKLKKPKNQDQKLDLLRTLLKKDSLKGSSRYLEAMFEERNKLLAAGAVVEAKEEQEGNIATDVDLVEPRLAS